MIKNFFNPQGLNKQFKNAIIFIRALKALTYNKISKLNIIKIKGGKNEI